MTVRLWQMKMQIIWRSESRRWTFNYILGDFESVIVNRGEFFHLLWTLTRYRICCFKEAQNRFDFFNRSKHLILSCFLIKWARTTAIQEGDVDLKTILSPFSPPDHLDDLGRRSWVQFFSNAFFLCLVFDPRSVSMVHVDDTSPD